MSLNVFCPHCAAKVPYDTVKPTRCPRCSKLFADAFRVAVPITAPVTRAAVVEEDLPDDQPITRQLAKAAVAKRNTNTQRDTPAPVSRIMNAPANIELPEDDGDDVEEEDADPRAVRRRARELAASIDPSTITIGDQDEGVFKFDQFWAEGQSAREKAAKKPAAKRSRRS